MPGIGDFSIGDPIPYCGTKMKHCAFLCRFSGTFSCAENQETKIIITATKTFPCYFNTRIIIHT